MDLLEIASSYGRQEVQDELSELLYKYCAKYISLETLLTHLNNLAKDG